MISFPFSVILIPYGLVVVFIGIFALANIMHLIHYGATTAVSFVVTFSYIAGIVFMFYFTGVALADVDWQAPVVIQMPSFGPPKF